MTTPANVARLAAALLAANVDITEAGALHLAEDILAADPTLMDGDRTEIERWRNIVDGLMTVAHGPTLPNGGPCNCYAHENGRRALRESLEARKK